MGNICTVLFSFIHLPQVCAGLGSFERGGAMEFQGALTLARMIDGGLQRVSKEPVKSEDPAAKGQTHSFL